MKNTSSTNGKRTLFIHIGTHRTATTSIQRTMNSNKKALLDQGFLYPMNTSRHQKIRINVNSNKKTVPQIARQLNKEADKRKKNVHSIVISDEALCMDKNNKLLAAFKNHFNVKLIYSLRRQDLWLESWYLQNTKWQWNAKFSHNTLEGFMKKRDMFHWIDYAKRVDILEQDFDQSDILLSVFERGQMPDGPVSQFIKQLGIVDTSAFVETHQINKSLSPQAHEFLRGLPLDRFNDRTKKTIVKASEIIDSKFLKNDGKKNSLVIPYRQRQSVFAQYETGNIRLAQRYFGRDHLFFDEYPMADIELASRELPTDSHELLRKIVSPIMRSLIELSKK